MHFTVPARLSLVAALAVGLALVLVVTAPASAGGGLGDRRLERGDHGDDVERLQEVLTGLGFKTRVDGSFGTGTERNVERYERSRDWEVDGAVSKREAKKLKRRWRRVESKDGGNKADEIGGGDKCATCRLGDRRLERGDSGNDVERLQKLLGELGVETQVDGTFGGGTEKNVKRYERSRDWEVDGGVSKSEAKKVKRRWRRIASKDDEGRGGKSQAGEDRPHRFGERPLKLGKRGRDVRKLQRLLTKMDIETHVDGDFGPHTARSVRRYERWQGKRVDGIVKRRQAKKMERLADRGAKRPKKSSGRDHVFPVRGSYGFGGPGSRFGAPRSGHTHQGQDIAAASGTTVVSVHDGRVATRQYQAGGAGNYIVIHGDDKSDSVYMHLLAPGAVEPGERVKAGETIGSVGCTGGCSGPHLHFELWTPHWYDGGHPYDPLPKLERWAD